jgi:hypothetical protein
MVHSSDRQLSVLRAVAAFGKERNRWPDLDALHAFRRRCGCRATVYRTLQRLRDLGLIELRGAGHASRWVPTEPAWDLLKRPAFVPALESRNHRADATTLLSGPSVSRFTSVPSEATPATLRRVGDGLAVFE